MRKIVLLSTQRSGTTMLVSMLNRHPDVLSIGEVFKHNSEINYPEYWYQGDIPVSEHLDWIFSRRASGAISIKVMYNQLLANRDAWSAIKRSCDGCLVVERTDIVGLVVSHYLAASSNLWVASSSSTTNYESKVRVDPHEFRNAVEKVYDTQKRIRRLASEFEDRAIITYEDLIDPSKDEMKSVLELFRVRQPEDPLTSSVRKLRSGSKWDWIENADEVRRTVADLDFEQL